MTTAPAPIQRTCVVCDVARWYDPEPEPSSYPELIFVCAYCGAINIADGDGANARIATEDERAELITQPDIQREVLFGLSIRAQREADQAFITDTLSVLLKTYLGTPPEQAVAFASTYATTITRAGFHRHILDGPDTEAPKEP